MKIRSITCFANPGWPLDETILRQVEQFTAAARLAFESAGYEVQTLRLATPPFPKLLPDCRAETVLAFAQALEAAVIPLGFNYIAIGPALPEVPESYAAIPPVVAATENIFASGLMGAPGGRVSLSGVRACAEVIHQLGPVEPNGFANLYFAALANVGPGAPFFPAAYHGQGGPAFAIACEAADLVVQAFTPAINLAAARQNLRMALEGHGRQIGTVAEELRCQVGNTISFGGIDFSPAPFPELELSLGTAMERLGLPAVGQHGSLAAAALIAETLDQANFPHAGFSGMMLPVLEDATLAQRAAEGVLSIKDLLLYSAVCGTGLDTVPLPGEVTVAALHALLLDLAVLAARLDKPLTARLMPIPGKQAGDATGFDFAFFANSRVMAIEAQALSGVLAEDTSFEIQARRPRQQR